MRRLFHLVILSCCIPIFMGCVARYGSCSSIESSDCLNLDENQETIYTCPPEDGKSQTFYASTGPVSYKNGILKWVNTQGGDIQLTQMEVTAGVYTDKNLTAECSELCSLCIGEELWLENCCVCGTSKAGGGAWMRGCKIFAELALGDNLQAENTVFHQNIFVNGNVSAQKTHFEGILQAKAEIIQFDQVYANHIIVNPTDVVYAPQVVCLKNHTIVCGDIYFPSSKGKIVLDSTSHIYGKIYGGKIIKPCSYE